MEVQLGCYRERRLAVTVSYQFITAIPLNFWKGSGCFMGIHTLAGGIRALGGEVNFVTPNCHVPVYAAKRILFNHQLRYREFSSRDTVVGFDADGYTIAGRRPAQHVASIKGVIADVLPYETGPARISLTLQAHLEKLHAQRAVWSSHRAATAQSGSKRSMEFGTQSSFPN